VVITIVKWITVALNTETPVTMKSPLAFTGIEVSVVGSMFVSISPVTIVEVMSSECNWVSIVRLSFIAVMSTILVGTPAAVIWKVTTVVLGRVWLGVGFLKHCSVIRAVWLPIGLLLNAIEVKRLLKMPLS